MTKQSAIYTAVIAAVCIAPIFVLANKIDGDEVVKGAVGVFAAAIVAIVTAVMGRTNGGD